MNDEVQLVYRIDIMDADDPWKYYAALLVFINHGIVNLRYNKLEIDLDNWGDQLHMDICHFIIGKW